MESPVSGMGIEQKDRSLKSAAGFTVIEIAMVTLISGFLITAGLHALQLYIKDKHLNQAYKKQEVMYASLSSYFSNNVSYPCPADPLLPIDDPMAGLQDCVTASTLTIGQCSGPGGVGGICKVAGRDTAVDPDTNPDPILIGAIPYRTMKLGIERMQCYSVIDGLPLACTDPNAFNPTDASLKEVNLDATLDPWGYQMTYAVTEAQTQQATFRQQHGAIAVETELGISLVQPPASAHYVLIAHGENHMGAHNPQGRIPYPCAGGTMDAENCDTDGLFVDGLRSMGLGAQYFDDVIRNQAYAISQLWEFSPLNPDHIFNLNPGNVGVGTSTPTQKLDVVGDMKAIDVKIATIRDLGGSNPWTPDLLGGPVGLDCSNPAQAPQTPNMFRVMSGIKNGAIVCSPPIPLPTGFASKSCPAGQFLTGVDTLGNIICN